MPPITFSYVAQRVADVTAEQIGKCHKCFDLNNKGQEFYLVENERGDLDPETQCIKEYKVTYSARYGFQCTCPAGLCGFATVRHASRVCKHCRWVVACVLEERAYMSERATKQQRVQLAQGKPTWYNLANETSYANGTRAHLLLIGYLEADDATYARVHLAKPTVSTETNVRRALRGYQSRPFALFKHPEGEERHM